MRAWQQQNSLNKKAPDLKFGTQHRASLYVWRPQYQDLILVLQTPNSRFATIYSILEYTRTQFVRLHAAWSCSSVSGLTTKVSLNCSILDLYQAN